MLTPDKPLVVVENFFSPTEYKLIKRRVDNAEVKCQPHISAIDAPSKDILYDTGWANQWFLDDGRERINTQSFITELVHTKIEEHFEQVKMIRVRTCNFTPVGKTMVHDPHVDWPHPHFTALLYTCTEENGGHTYFWNEFYDPFMYKGINDQLSDSPEKFGLDKALKIAPKENTVVFFRGDMFHASSAPDTIVRRSAVNINFEGYPRHGNT